MSVLVLKESLLRVVDLGWCISQQLPDTCQVSEQIERQALLEALAQVERCVSRLSADQGRWPKEQIGTLESPCVTAALRALNASLPLLPAPPAPTARLNDEVKQAPRPRLALSQAAC